MTSSHRRNASAWLAAVGLAGLGVAGWALLLLFVATPLRQLEGISIANVLQSFAP